MVQQGVEIGAHRQTVDVRNREYLSYLVRVEDEIETTAAKEFDSLSDWRDS